MPEVAEDDKQQDCNLISVSMGPGAAHAVKLPRKEEAQPLAIGHGLTSAVLISKVHTVKIFPVVSNEFIS